MLLLLLATVLVCGGCSKSSSGSDGGPDADTDSDTDTDTGSDSDSESDIDTETEEGGCGAPTGVTGWGGPCHTNADCPADTECIKLNGMDQSQGYCAPECCNFETADPGYCTDVSTGQEGCLIWPVECYLESSPYYCAITCNTPADCPTGTDCVDAGGQLICYGFAPVVDAGPDAACTPVPANCP